MIYLRDRALTRYNITDTLFSSDIKKNSEFTKNIKVEENRIIKNNQIFIYSNFSLIYINKIKKNFDKYLNLKLKFY